MEKNALHSLYGEGHVNATRLRECVAMPGTRNQVVLTPQGVVDGLMALWPEGVAYDAAGTDDQGSLVNAAQTTQTRGLLDPWPHRTYCNPPYGKSLFDPETQMEALLEEERIRKEHKEAGKKSIKWPEGLPVKKAGLWNWLEKQLEQYTKSVHHESVLLVPNRTNRKWLRDWRNTIPGAVELDPLCFVGHKQSFPAPLVLGFAGPLWRVDDFYEAFAHLGDPVRK